MIETPPCEHRIKLEGTDNYIFCANSNVDAKGGIVPIQMCGICPQRTIPCEEHRQVPKDLKWVSRGFGDTVKKFTDMIGISPCGGCLKRQREWNAAAPYNE